MSCFCMPPPASMQPRKTYNMLVPDVFPAAPPHPDEPISASVRRRIGKLEEYAQANPGKIGKVSRRLMRRISRSLSASQLGYVKIGVHAYIYLLAKSVGDDSKYTFNYLSEELIHQHDPVIMKLLCSSKPQAQALGAELLANYIKAQDEVENQADINESLVEVVCRLSVRENVPNMLKVACLRAIYEYVLFCHRLKRLPGNLEDIQASTLNSMDLEGKGELWLQQHSEFGTAVSADASSTHTATAATASSSPVAAAVQAVSAGVVAPGTVSAASWAEQVQELAQMVLLQFRPFLQDISTVYRVMDTLFGYLDQGSKWQRPLLVQGLMALITRSCQDQPFPLFSALMRHSNSAKLSALDRAVIVRLAVSQGSVYSLSAFSLALQELPKTICTVPDDTNAAARQGLYATVKTTIRQLALEVGDVGQLCEALASSLRAHSGSSQTTTALLQCAVEAVSSVDQYWATGRTFPGQVFPATLLQTLSSIAMAAEDQISSRMALRVLATLLPAAENRIPDEGHASSLLSAVFISAQQANHTPPDLCILDSIAAAAVSPAKPAVLLMAVQLVVALQRHALQLDTASLIRPSPAHSCALLLLCNSLLQHVAAAARCTPLLQQVLPLDSAVCRPALLLTAAGLTAPNLAGTQGLGSSGTLEQMTSLQPAALEAARQHCLSQAAVWPVQLGRALAQEGLLHQEYGTGLAEMLSQPFQLSPATASAVVAAMPTKAGQLLNGTTPLASSNGHPARVRLNSVNTQRMNLRNVLSILGGSEEDEEEEKMQLAGLTARKVAPAPDHQDSTTPDLEDLLRAGAAAKAQHGTGVPHGRQGQATASLQEVLQMVSALPPVQASKPSSVSQNGLPQAAHLAAR